MNIGDNVIVHFERTDDDMLHSPTVCTVAERSYGSWKGNYIRGFLIEEINVRTNYDNGTIELFVPVSVCEPIKTNTESIKTGMMVETRFVGDSTVSQLIRDGKAVKTASTKKHPDDKYDMLTGAMISMQRLFSKDRVREGSLINFRGLYFVVDKVDEFTVTVKNPMYGIHYIEHKEYEVVHY